MDDVTIIPPNASGSLDEPRSVALSIREPRTMMANPIASIRLTSISEILQFAEHASRSGMVPETYRGKPADIVIAVMQGAELGLPPIQALNSIAVINGRPSVWGDAVPGLCYASGKVEDIEEYFEGDQGTDGYTAVCMAKRRGVPSPKIGRFSQADAKTAGLFGKATHSKYPARMMMWRARHFALHDAFPDVLRGIGTRELDAEDAEANTGPRWSTPMPERGGRTEAAGARVDGWDDTWYRGVEAKLLAEPNGLAWMRILIGALKEAPSKRDIDEIADRKDVQSGRANAPVEAREKIDMAFNQAWERFKTPATGKVETKAEPEKAKPKLDDAVQIEAVIVDQYGEIKGDYSDPVEFATDFVALYKAAKDDAEREALHEHNADALDEVLNASGDAAAILKAIEPKAPVESKPAEATLEPPVVLGKVSWPAYVKLLKETLPTIGGPRFAAWALAQRPVLEKAPTAQRALAIRAISENAGRLSLAQPAWLGEIVKAPAAKKADAPATSPAADSPAADDDEAPYAPSTATRAPAEPERELSADERWVEEQIAETRKVKTLAEFNALIGSMAVRTKMSRLRRENVDLFNKADEVFSTKMAEVRG